MRAIVVDDSATERALITTILRDGGIDVVGEARDGASAVAMVRELRPTVVVMDIHMPDVDGFEATRRIMSEAPTPIVIVTASYQPTDVAIGLRATQLGALTVQPKPAGPGAENYAAAAARFVSLVRAMADVKIVGRRGRLAPVTGSPLPDVRPRLGADRIEIVGVGASTGGPAALFQFLGALPADLAAPVLVVQHLPEGFTTGFVRWLATATPLRVRVVEQSEPLHAGVVHVAPHGSHLEIAPGARARLSHGALIQGFRPSVSALFSSLAISHGPAAAGVILTGMGSDGLEGARALRHRGGLVLVQDQDSSAVFGMPRAVSEAGLAHVVGPVEELAREIGQLTNQQGSRA